MLKVLREAQALGYTGADPSTDVEGFDVKVKISILAKLVGCKEITDTFFFILTLFVLFKIIHPLSVITKCMVRVGFWNNSAT